MGRTKTKIAGIELDSYIFNASGIRDSTLDELEKIGESGSSAILLKSCSLEPRKGNEKPREVDIPSGYFQSEGLPNLGYKKYLEFIPKLKKYKKPIGASVIGFSLEEYKLLVKAFQESKADLIEVNLSCPNIVEEGLPITYDFDKIRKLLDKISDLGKKPLGLKLPAYLCPVLQERMADLIQEFNIPFISLINSIGNTLLIDPKSETTLIKPQGGFGGLSGGRIKPIALGNVRRFYELLKNKVSIIGVGGIRTGEDAFEFLLSGADAVQVGTTFKKEGVGCFKRMNTELEKILQRKNYNSIEDAKGELRGQDEV